MSEFSRTVSDYIRFDEYDIEERFGSEALEAVLDAAQSQLDDLTDAFDFADSEEEREFALEQIEDFEFDELDAENIASDFEFSFLQDYMSQSYKSDYDLIERYVELVGSGSGGGGSVRSSPAPSREEILERQIKEFRRELNRIGNTEEDIDEILQIIERLEKQLKDLRGDED
tara:strand:- start:436 stop:951 length:516 start_codon:yes stop_codon:yes gene_type:complete